MVNPKSAKIVNEVDTKNQFLYLEIFDSQVKLPFNTPTVINKNVAGNKTNSMSLNILSFSVGEIEFFMQGEPESVLVKATSTTQNIPEYFELRVIEVLQFLLARPLRWSIMIKQTNGSISSYIREIQSENLKYNVEPPISLALDNTYEFCKIFGCYLEHIVNYQEKKPHPISAQMRSICQASIGTIETKSLILSVAVESILKHVHKSNFQLSSEEKKWIKNAQEYFNSWDGPVTLSRRIAGFLTKLSNPSASVQLKELVELGAITQEQYKAWSSLRNKLAHGGGLGSASLQEFFELSNTVLVLFYHLVFFAIGYQGNYIDYSTIGWPTKAYRVVHQTEEFES